jgi:hypothetical protein
MCNKYKKKAGEKYDSFQTNGYLKVSSLYTKGTLFSFIQMLLNKSLESSVQGFDFNRDMNNLKESGKGFERG